MSRHACLLSAALIFLFDGTAAQSQQDEQPPRCSVVDLQLHYNHDMDENFHRHDHQGNVLTELRPGNHVFCGIPFRIGDGVMQLRSANRYTVDYPDKEYPEQIGPIDVDSKCASLHILHANGYDDPGNPQIGEYLIHYDDGQEASFPIVYGKNIRNWWVSPQDEPSGYGGRKTLEGAALVWEGQNPATQAVSDRSLALYATSWTNPHPEKRVKSLFMKTDAKYQSAPFCVAITVDRRSTGIDYTRAGMSPEMLQKSCADTWAAPVEITNSIGMKFVLVPAGQYFLMGSPADEQHRERDERQHPVEICEPYYYLASHEVTREQYSAITGNSPSQSPPGGFYGAPNGHGNTDKFPVDSVSCSDAVEFCRKLSQRPEEEKEHRRYRLATEAEWEYACRAGTATPFHFGVSCNGREANCDGRKPYGTSEEGPYLQRTTEVGSYVPNAWGLHDMHGNVREWCHDGYVPDCRRLSLAEDLKRPGRDQTRVVRGGSWDFPPVYARSAARFGHPPNDRMYNIGFRVVMSIRKPEDLLNRNANASTLED
jgi:formylglycine-generating enzyme required for sulfatase activity